MTPVRLNIGCGKDIREGWINVDYVEKPGVDLVHDLNDPLPFSNDSVEEIYASHILEHLDDPIVAIRECHRVLVPDGKLTIRVPYGLSKYNPTLAHKRFFYPASLDVFTNESSKGLDMDRLSGMFVEEERKIFRMLWFKWHLKKYLRISFFDDRLYSFPVGAKYEIRWVLRKRVP